MYRIGVDLGGTKISAAVTDSDYNIVSKVSCPTNAKRHSDEIALDIARLCDQAAESAGINKDQVISIGVGTPGAVDSSRGVVEYSCNLPFLSYPLAEKLAKMTQNKNVYIENDANAAALGESVAGASKNSSSSIMVTLGTGVGGGVIIDGKILCGYNGTAGELGHMVIVHNGVECPCGRRGCFEAYCSATALVRMTKEKLVKLKEDNIPSLMLEKCENDPEKADTRTAFDASKQGDEQAKALIGEYIGYLACGITNLINIFQPEIITIGGGLSGEGDYLLDALVPLVEKEQYTRSYKKKTTIKIAKLGNDAGIIGAAALGSMAK